MKALILHGNRLLQKAGEQVAKSPKPLAKTASHTAPFAFAELLHSARSPETRKMAPVFDSRSNTQATSPFAGKTGMGEFKSMVAPGFVGRREAEGVNFARSQEQQPSASKAPMNMLRSVSPMAPERDARAKDIFSHKGINLRDHSLTLPQDQHRPGSAQGHQQGLGAITPTDTRAEVPVRGLRTPAYEASPGLKSELSNIHRAAEALTAGTSESGGFQVLATKPRAANSFTARIEPDSASKSMPCLAADNSQPADKDQRLKTAGIEVLSKALTGISKTGSQGYAEIQVASPAPSGAPRGEPLANAKQFDPSSAWNESVILGRSIQPNELTARDKGEVAAERQFPPSARDWSRPFSRISAPVERMIPWLNREAKLVLPRNQERMAGPTRNESAPHPGGTSDSGIAAVPRALESQTKGKKVAPELIKSGAAHTPSADMAKNFSKPNFTMTAALEKILLSLNRETRSARSTLPSPGTATATRIEYFRNLSGLAEKIQARAQLRNGGNSLLEFQLTPPHLGSVLLRVETEGQEMRLHFGAQSESAMQMLKDMRTDLASAVSQQGYDLKRCDVEYQAMHDHRPPTEGAVWADRQRTSRHMAVPSGSAGPSLEGEWVEESAPRLDFGYNTLDLVA